MVQRRANFLFSTPRNRESYGHAGMVTDLDGPQTRTLTVPSANSKDIDGPIQFNAMLITLISIVAIIVLLLCAIFCIVLFKVNPKPIAERMSDQATLA
ncbi:hypothetical protein SNEBB_003541 [Seison nebaliae]|nr:hypothetical protein SNEBB_003541 [Seison nebaliae]